MLGRGIDQIMPSPGSPRLYEAHATSALCYLELAEQLNGPIPRKVAPDYVWGDALAIMEHERPAVRIINLETAITVSDQYWPKGINYRMHPANVACLQAAGIDCCVLANNHVLDWGREGLLETLMTLQRAGISIAGAGCNDAEADAPAVLPIAGGGRVLVFGFASGSSGVPQEWAARATTPGVNLLTDLSEPTARRFAEFGMRLRQPGDLLIASIHWGGNWGYAIPAAEQTFAHALIDGGFDLVHGHSSHHAKAIEIYQHKLVLYGCGDFINDYEGIFGYEDYRPDLVLMYLPRVDLQTGRLLSLHLVPMQIRRFRLNQPSLRDTEWLYKVLAHESAKLGTAMRWLDDGSFTIGMEALGPNVSCRL